MKSIITKCDAADVVNPGGRNQNVAVDDVLHDFVLRAAGILGRGSHRSEVGGDSGGGDDGRGQGLRG